MPSKDNPRPAWFSREAYELYGSSYYRTVHGDKVEVTAVDDKEQYRFEDKIYLGEVTDWLGKGRPDPYPIKEGIEEYDYVPCWTERLSVLEFWTQAFLPMQGLDEVHGFENTTTLEGESVVTCFKGQDRAIFVAWLAPILIINYLERNGSLYRLREASIANVFRALRGEIPREEMDLAPWDIEPSL